jgi:hypothetical protein
MIITWKIRLHKVTSLRPDSLVSKVSPCARRGLNFHRSRVTPKRHDNYLENTFTQGDFIAPRHPRKQGVSLCPAWLKFSSFTGDAEAS